MLNYIILSGLCRIFDRLGFHTCALYKGAPIQQKGKKCQWIKYPEQPCHVLKVIKELEMLHVEELCGNAPSSMFSLLSSCG
jgi:hypothetical protein